jgi:hypothetical protein
MLPLLIPMGIGALGGALLKKKDPLKGALLGAGLGLTAGAAAPAIGGLLGGGAAGTAAGTAATAATGAAGAVPAALPAAALPETGLLASTNAALTKYKPIIDAATTGISMSGALDEQPEQAAPAPAPMTQGGPETLAAIAGQGAPSTVQAGMQERARRRAMLRGGV